MKWTVAVAAFALSGILAAPCALASHYQLDMTVLRDGTVVSAPSVVVEESQQADLSTHDEKHPGSDLRMLVGATAGKPQKDGKDTIEVNLTFFDRVNGEWVLRGKPTVAVYPGTQASLTLDSKGPEHTASNYEIRILARPFESVKTGDQAAAKRAVGQRHLPGNAGS